MTKCKIQCVIMMRGLFFVGLSFSFHRVRLETTSQLIHYSIDHLPDSTDLSKYPVNIIEKEFQNDNKQLDERIQNLEKLFFGNLRQQTYKTDGASLRADIWVPYLCSEFHLESEPRKKESLLELTVTKASESSVDLCAFCTKRNNTHRMAYLWRFKRILLGNMNVDFENASFVAGRLWPIDFPLEMTQIVTDLLSAHSRRLVDLADLGKFLFQTPVCSCHLVRTEIV